MGGMVTDNEGADEGEPLGIVGRVRRPGVADEGVGVELS